MDHEFGGNPEVVPLRNVCRCMLCTYNSPCEETVHVLLRAELVHFHRDITLRNRVLYAVPYGVPVRLVVRRFDPDVVSCLVVPVGGQRICLDGPHIGCEDQYEPEDHHQDRDPDVPAELRHDGRHGRDAVDAGLLMDRAGLPPPGGLHVVYHAPVRDRDGAPGLPLLPGALWDDRPGEHGAVVDGRAAVLPHDLLAIGES